MKKIAIQGQKASFHDQAAHTFFGEDIDLTCCHSFKDVFETLTKGEVDNAVVAFENSLYGSINNVHDLLVEHRFWIIGEVYVRVQFCLIGLPGAQTKNITQIYSQNFALEECEEFLATKLPQAKAVEEFDTAGSVELIKSWDDQGKAAIASEQAAQLHGMKILARNIETHHENYTRFVVLAPKRQDVPEANKTSLILTTQADTRPGALLRALQVFADRDINMTMLQSRPIIGKAWHYMFYIDVEIGSQNPIFGALLDELKTAGCDTIVLGSYRAGHTL